MFQRERSGASQPEVALQLRSSADDLEELHARKGDVETCPTGEASQQGAEHAGGRVRPRGNPSRPGGETRRAFDKAGDRDWSVEGATRRCQSAAPGPRLQRCDEAQCEVGDSGRASRPQTCLAAPIPRRQTGIEARGPQRRVAQSAFTPGKNHRPSPVADCAELIGSPRRAHQRAAGKTCRRSQSRAHTAEAATGERLR